LQLHRTQAASQDSNKQRLFMRLTSALTATAADKKAAYSRK